MNPKIQREEEHFTYKKQRFKKEEKEEELHFTYDSAK